MSGLRLNVGAFYEALDSARVERGLSWYRLARETGLSANVFSRMTHGMAPSADSLVTLLLWLGWAPELLMVAEARP